MIEVKNISKKYGNSIAVDDVSFRLEKGEITGFLGINGAGKSTSMKIITGVLQADSGSVQIFGYDIGKNPIEAKSRTGYLSEVNPLPENMYVKEYLEYIAGIYNMKNRREVIERSIEDFGLKNEYRKKIAALSKGNRQKLGLAQALIHDPDFLILDEPTSALDPNQRADLKEMIKKLGQTKIILFSTHILHEVEDIASRIIILQHGKVRADKKMNEIGSLETLFQTTTHEDSSR